MLKERGSVVSVQYGRLDVIDGAFVLVDTYGVRTQIPVGGLACVMLETGTTITHEAVKLASRVGCLLMWVADGVGRVYASGAHGGARADRLLLQAKAAIDESARLQVVREMYRLRFQQEPPKNRSVQQLRGIEGSRVRRMYELLARQYRIPWNRRSYKVYDWNSADPVNRALSTATASLYGVCEAAILIAGYSPAIGYIHTGKPLSFVYDIADIFKFDTVVPAAFRTVARNSQSIERDTRIACRDLFRSEKILKRIVPVIDRVIHASGLQPPQVQPDQLTPAIPNAGKLSDGSRNN
ncbi:MAG: type I-E CRISPR-associated endonuclease Cas1e [Alkalispirochaeta sp.]